jgi:hypothetical protein
VAGAKPVGVLAWLRRAIGIEDALLFLWIVVLQQGLVRWVGPELGLLATGAWEPAWLVWLTAGGLAVALFTRGPADTDMHAASSRRCLISLILWFGARAYLGGSESWKGALILWVAVGFVVLAPLQAIERLPQTSLGLRRALVLPAQLVGNSLFVTQVTPEFLRGAALPGEPAARLWLSLLLAAFLFLYAVVGPRVLAGEAWTPGYWLVRFGIYVVALWLGRPSWAAPFR